MKPVGESPGVAGAPAAEPVGCSRGNKELTHTLQGEANVENELGDFNVFNYLVPILYSTPNRKQLITNFFLFCKLLLLAKRK